MANNSRPQRGVERRPVTDDYTLDEIDLNKKKSQLLIPHVNFLKSPEGVKEYKRYGLSYPNNNRDLQYEKLLTDTPAVEGNDYRHKNKTRITYLVRLRLTPEKQYLLWDQRETRYDPLGNPHTITRTGMGRYPIIGVSKVMVQKESGLKEVVEEVTGKVSTGYLLPYTLTNIDKLHENCNDEYEYDEVAGKEVRPTNYAVYDGRKKTSVAIKEWASFRDGDFDELYTYGKKIESDKEAQAIKDKIELERQKVEQQKIEQLKQSV